MESHVKAHPDDTAAAIKLAGIYLRRGDNAEAMAIISSVEKQGPAAEAQLTPLYLQLGTDSAENNKIDAAIPWFQKVIDNSKDPDSLAKAHINLAICYIQQKKLDEAATEANGVIASDGASKDDKAMAQRIVDYVKTHPAAK
ncbi:MAG TPA: tetratricopeptide repeat protein [Armatimonadota bacterium]|nr:tetratricopeptide repeat protein [Armatimonadota bacterium]